MYKYATQMYTHAMSNYSAARAREYFSEVITQAQSETVFIERRGEVAAVVISPSQYQAMLDALDDIEDTAAFDQAMAEEGPNVPWEEIKADLGWA